MSAGCWGSSLKGSLAGLASMWRWFRTPHRADDDAVRRERRVPDVRPRRCPRPTSSSISSSRWSRITAAPRCRATATAATPACCGPKAAAPCGWRAATRHTTPLIDPAFLSDERDIDLLRRGVRAMYRILEAPPMRALGGRDRYPIDLERRRRARTADPRAAGHDLPPGRHRAHGIGRGRGVRPAAARARGRRAVRRRRVDHAEAGQRQHQRARRS